MVTKTFEITTSSEVMQRIERFLALLHHNSVFGHSGIFGMSLDGDGADKVSVSPKPKHSGAVDAIGNVGYDIELANNRGFHGKKIDKKANNKWRVETRAVLLCDDEVKKVMTRA